MTIQISPLNDAQFFTLEKEFQNQRPDLKVIEQMTDKPNKRCWGIVSFFFQKKESKWLTLLKKINQRFIQLEQEGISIFDSTVSECKEQAQDYRNRYQRYLQVTEKVLELSKSDLLFPKLKEMHFELRCRLVGCRYQLGKDHGGLSPLKEPNQALLEKLKTAAEQWKSRQDLAFNKHLNHIDISQLKELAQYPEWVKVVLENPNYLKEVFSWCLKDDCSPEILVKCYETRKILKASLLSSYVGYGRNRDVISRENEILAFRDLPTKVHGVSKRVLTIAVYHGSFHEFEPHHQERVNILDPNQEIFFKQGNRKITVREFTEESRRKNDNEVKTNICIYGVINRHPHYGVWQEDKKTYDTSHMSKKDWIHHVPPIAIVAHEELGNRYGPQNVNRRQMFFKVMSSRQYVDGLNAASAHSYILMYIPMKDGNWKVLSIGFFAYRFQRGRVDEATLIGATSPRVLCEMDQNHCYTMRRRAEAAPIFPEQAEMEKFLALLAKKRTGGVFQFSARNCAHPIQKYAEKYFSDLPNFFRMPLTKGKLGIGSFDNLLHWADQKSKEGRASFIGILHRALGSRRVLHVRKEDPTQPKYCVYTYINTYIQDWNKYWFYHFVVDSLQWFIGYPSCRQIQKTSSTKNYSVYEYFKKYGEEVYNPSYLHHQIETKKIEGTIYWSLTDEKVFQKPRK